MSCVRAVRVLSLRAMGIATLLLSACAGPAIAPRVDVPPPMPVGRELPLNPPDGTDAIATQRWLEQEANRQRGAVAQDPSARREVPPPVSAPTNEDATRAWFDRTIEERRSANPAQPPAPIYQTVERTVYVDRPTFYSDMYAGYGTGDYRGYGYDEYGQPLYVQPYYYRSRGHRSTFPVNTAIGAGIGAIIGHQSHHRDRGAAIGAGIGLLFDLAR